VPTGKKRSFIDLSVGASGTGRELATLLTSAAKWQLYGLSKINKFATDVASHTMKPGWKCGGKFINPYGT
jgi:hypothetical protein